MKSSGVVSVSGQRQRDTAVRRRIILEDSAHKLWHDRGNSKLLSTMICRSMQARQEVRRALALSAQFKHGRQESSSVVLPGAELSPPMTIFIHSPSRWSLRSLTWPCVRCVAPWDLIHQVHAVAGAMLPAKGHDRFILASSWLLDVKGRRLRSVCRLVLGCVSDSTGLSCGL